MSLTEILRPIGCYVQMTSVERILQYTALDQEAPAHSDDVDIPADWPTEGAIKFQDVTLQYLQDALPALSNVDFSINSGEKVKYTDM